MNKVKFSTGTDPAVVEVFSPFSGQLARVHRHPSVRSRKPIVLFPESGGQIMRVPKFGNYLENLAFAIFGGASLAVLLMSVLAVN